MIEEWVNFVLEETWDQQRVDHAEMPTFNKAEKYFVNGWGFVAYRPLTKTLTEVHIAMLRGAKGTKQFSLETLELMRKEGTKKFLAPIAEFNRAAIMLAKACGFKQEGCITKAFERDGKPYALLLFGRE